jgi:hypothetical protein
MTAYGIGHWALGLEGLELHMVGRGSGGIASHKWTRCRTGRECLFSGGKGGHGEAAAHGECIRQCPRPSVSPAARRPPVSSFLLPANDCVDDYEASPSLHCTAPTGCQSWYRTLVEVLGGCLRLGSILGCWTTHGTDFQPQLTLDVDTSDSRLFPAKGALRPAGSP